jgi:hypothetical protein
VPWIVNDKNERFLRSKRINDDEATNRNLFDETDPDKAKFCNDTFKKHMRYGAQIFEFDHKSYVLRLDTFPMRNSNFPFLDFNNFHSYPTQTQSAVEMNWITSWLARMLCAAGADMVYECNVQSKITYN